MLRPLLVGQPSYCLAVSHAYNARAALVLLQVLSTAAFLMEAAADEMQHLAPFCRFSTSPPPPLSLEEHAPQQWQQQLLAWQVRLLIGPVYQRPCLCFCLYFGCSFLAAAEPPAAASNCCFLTPT